MQAAAARAWQRRFVSLVPDFNERRKRSHETRCGRERESVCVMGVGGGGGVCGSSVRASVYVCVVERPTV